MRQLKWSLSVVLALCATLANVPAQAEDIFTELNAAYTATLMHETGSGNWHGLVGGAVIALQQPVADRKNYILPLVAINYRRTLYWHFGQLGAYVLSSEDRRARLSIALKARRGYDPDNYPALAGMEERKTSLEAGLQGYWLTHRSLIHYGVFSDISNRSNGTSAQLGLAHPFRLAPRWHLTPSLGLEWLSDKVVDYYYGVKPGEATASRPVYTGTASTNLRVGLMLSHRLAHDWSLFGGVAYIKLGSGISDSPIVIHDSIRSLTFGAGWHF